MQNYPVRLLSKIIGTDSPSGVESLLARKLAVEMRNIGYRVRRDKIGNVIGEVGGKGPRILLCGHLDTVPGRVPFLQKGGRIYGRGAVDAKSSLAAMIVGCALACRHSPSFRGTVAGVVEEETTSAGIKGLMSNAGPWDMAIFGEPSGTSNIIIGYKGSLNVEVVCSTPGGHSSSPWLSRNSLEEAFGFWELLRESLLDNDAVTKFESLTGSMTQLKTSEGANTIPSCARMTIDVRIPPHRTLFDTTRRIEKLASEYQSSREDLKLDVSFANETIPYVGLTDSILVSAFRGAIRRVTGKQVQLVKKTGTSDMNHLAEKASVPMIAYGPGDSRLDHTDRESISIAEYLQSIDVFTAAIQRLPTLIRDLPQVSA